MNDGAHRAIGALLHAAGLSDEQREQMHAVLEADRATVEPILDQLRTANESLVDRLLASDTPSPEPLDQLTEGIADLRRQLLQQQVRTVLALRDVLTPEQLDGLAAQHPLRPDADVVFRRR